MKQRKRGIRRMFAGAMAVLMMLSVVDVSGWGVMNAKAEETTTALAKNMPESLAIYDDESGKREINIIKDGALQADEVSDNEDTIYQGTNWYYDSTKNQLVLNGTSIRDVFCKGGDLSILLSGKNTLRGEIKFNVDGGSNTLEINGGNDNGSLIGKGGITVGTGDDLTNNLKITGATTETVDIKCTGDLIIENSHIVACPDGNLSALSGNTVSIKDSYVEAKSTEDMVNPISSQNGITISGSQILVETGKVFGENEVIQNVNSSNSVITKKWKDYETGVDVTKTSVYGKATLKEDLTIASGESIEFESGASITNPEKLTLADGVSLLVNGVEHTHNTDGDVTYTCKDDNEHIKNVACKDCPIGYVTKETESHSIGENGFCACNEVYQPANLTTDKYDMDGDGSKDAVYEISNAGQLYWFAGLVNGTLSGIEQNTSANAVLTADIVVNKNVLKPDGTLNEGSSFKEWTPVGVGYDSSYTGIFDGKNNTISGLYFSNQDKVYVGLFGYNSGKISNVGILDSYFYGASSVGGVIGTNYGTITNCYNAGSVNGTSDSVGGVIGSNYGTITNCYYNSSIYTGNAIGADDVNATCEKVEGKTTEQFQTGEVAYLLQSDQSEEVWGQTIKTDTYPTLGGAKVYKAATYKGCEGKPGEAESYAYSNTEKNTYGDHQDADNDGKCDDCGAIIDGIGAKLAGYSLSLTGNIGVNFYMELSNKIIADKDAYMQFTLPNGTITKVLVSEAQTNTTINAEKTYYRFPCEVSSYEMTQDIKAQMFDGNGNGGKEYTYTVRDYAQYLINHVDLYVDAVPFAMAMLNYGACSQKYFNKAVDELANKYLTGEEQEIPDRFDGYINGFVAEKAENDVLGQFAGFSMVLKSETTLNIFYEPKEGIDVSKLNFIVDGKEITPVKRGQYYILSLENIKANELGNSKKFTVTDGTNTLSGDYCAMMYCYQVLQAQEGTYEDALVTLVKAFSNYAYTAQSICKSN